MMKKGLKSETAIYGVAKYASVFVTLLTTSVLSHILSPEEYGVVAVTTVFTVFFNVIADLGFGTAVIQNKTLTDDEINDIFSFTAFAAFALGALFALLGFFIARFYGDGVYIKICALLSLAVFFTAMNIVPHGMLMKQKRFALMGKRLITAALVTGSIAIVLALVGFSYYALVLQTILHAAFMFFWNMYHARPKFRLRFSIRSVAKVSRYSLNQLAYSIVEYLEGNFDSFLIGKAMGSVNLAYYDKGYRLMMYPVQNLTYVITPVIHPVLSEYQDDKKYIYDAYRKIVRVLSMLGVFISLFCFWASEEIIWVFFGEQWGKSVPLFRILSLSVWPQMVVSSARSIYQSMNNTRLLFRSGLVHLSVIAALVITGVVTGDLQIVASLTALGMLMRFFIDYYFLIKKNFGYSYRSFLWDFRKEVLTAAVLGIFIAAMWSVDIPNIIVSLVLKGCMLFAVYVVTLLATGQFAQLKNMLYKVIKKR